MKVGVPKETAPGERRVALVPEVVERLVQSGFEILVEPGAGDAATYEDSAFVEAGAQVGEGAWGADAVVKVQKPSESETGRLHEGQVLIAFLQPLTDREGIDPAHHARPADGRALLAGNGRRIPGDADRRRAAAPLPADADDGGRHGSAGQGARPRCRGRRAPGDRHRAPPRRGHVRLRR